MPGFDALAPDQKAVLQLLLKQGKSYGDIAGLLRLEPARVRERALDALDALGAEHSAGLDGARQDELADHLLLQQSDPERAQTRTFLEGSPEGRRWARSVAAELRPIGGDALPDIPADPAAVADTSGAVGERSAARERGAAREGGAEREGSAAREGHPESSRRGGVVVLCAVALVIAIAVALLVRGGGDDEPSAAALPTASTTTAAAAARCALPTGATGVAGAIDVEGTAELPEQQIALKPPEGSTSKALGAAVISQGGLAFQAERLAENRGGYRAWLWTSAQEALPLGYAVYDAKTRRYAGTIEALPAAARRCGQLVLTRERVTGGAQPGTVVLRGAVRSATG